MNAFGRLLSMRDVRVAQGDTYASLVLSIRPRASRTARTHVTMNPPFILTMHLKYFHVAFAENTIQLKFWQIQIGIIYC